ncbi:MAG: iron ABC transporter permease [Pseudomonadales bacterium]|nr:iron ABC transporter permease [Pseudomonadales bacterium]
MGGIGLLCALLLGVVSGSVSLSPGSVWQALFPGAYQSAPPAADAAAHTRALNADQVALIVQQLRLPRVLLAACIGALLAVSGAVMQGLFRNPLADPSLIGVTAGAIAGASLVIVFGSALAASELWPALASWLNAGQVAGLSLVSLGAFIGGALTVWLVYQLASTSAGTSVSTMLLAGIAITALAGSLSSLLEFYADNAMLRRISVWRMGGLDGAGYHGLLFAALCLALVLAVLPRYARALNLLLLGESEARHLGINVERLKLSLVLIVALAVGVSVALAGSIAFIGLIVPHIVRLLIGPDHRALLPLAALVGAILLVLADCLARTLIAPAELPLGVITALLGAPFFISLLRSRHQYGF